MSRPVYYDCLRCGACCTNTRANEAEGFREYVEIGARDVIRRKPELMRRFAVVSDDGAAHLRLDREGRCMALRGAVGRNVRCAIYGDRPSPCRRVEAGSRLCLEYRRDKGLDAP